MLNFFFRNKKKSEDEEKDEEEEEGKEKTDKATRRWIQEGQLEVGVRAEDSRVVFRDGSWESSYVM